jgi:hypothetical protein
MWAISQFVRLGSRKWSRRWIAIVALSLAATAPLVAQYGGPHSTTTIGGHFLAPPPSVTSLAGRHLPPPAPSVTSIPNFGFQYHHGQYFNGYHRGRDYPGGFGYAIPYYYPADNYAYGYDYMGGGSPDLYSGPPLGPNDQNPHIVVEQPPARAYAGDPPDTQAYASTRPAPQPPPPAVEVKPGEPTVLVFRNGHHQEVTNYAIMGDTLYSFDEGRKKIALAELDIPATIKANDERGLEFRVPPSPSKKNSALPLPQSSPPEEKKAAPASVASAMP